MPRFDHGLLAGENIRQRPSSEGGYGDLESGSNQPASEDSGEITHYRRLCRAVIVQGCRDLGSGTIKDGEDIEEWIHSENFEMLCEFSGWEDAWVREMFEGILSMNRNVRCVIAKQCAKLLKAISTLQKY